MVAPALAEINERCLVPKYLGILSPGKGGAGEPGPGLWFGNVETNRKGNTFFIPCCLLLTTMVEN